jgi:hypothetical protein
LEDRIALGFPSELGIDHFVRPGAETARRFDATENVGSSVPPAHLKGTLNNESFATGHRRAGCCDRIGIDPDPINGGYRDALRDDMLDKALFMQRAPLRKPLEHRIPDLQLLQLAVCDLEIESRQKATVQMAYWSTELRSTFPLIFCIYLPN